MALFAEGKLFREAGTGSGGGDKHNKGYFVDESALTTAYPTAEAGDYAIVESTDTVWVWDSDNQEWVDSDQKGQVTSVNNQTGAVTVSEVPSQTGNAGKFLTTDGTDASWSDKPLVNQATGNQSIALLSPSTSAYSVVIGKQCSVSSYNTTAIGQQTSTSADASVAIGYNLSCGGRGSVCLGQNCRTNANNAIQISSSFNNYTNSDANTFKVGNENGNYEIMSADGTIPADRLTHAINKYSTMPTAASTNEGWIVQFTGTTDSTYTHGYLYECKAQGTDPETYAWEAVEVQAGGGIQNTATGNQSVTLLGTPTNKNYAMNIGLNSTANGNYSFAVGRYATANGNNTQVIGSAGTAYGNYDLVVGSGNIASGCHGSIVVGVVHNILTPVEESNVAVFMLDDHNYKILDSDGSIPTDRLIKNSIPHYTTMPAATPDLSGTIAQYIGTTDSSYTNGYFYKCSQGTSSATASQTTGSGLSDVAVVVATFETQATDSGSYVFTYSAADSAWLHDYLITDLADWGITYTGTPADADVITVVYDNGLGWAQVDVQPSSGSSYTAGTGIDITNDVISVQMPVKYNDDNSYAIGIGTQLGAFVYNSVAIGTMASAATEAVNIGGQGPVPQGTISIGNFQSTPSERGVVLFHTQDSNFNYHTYKMLEEDGTVPTARLTKVNTTATLAVADWSSSTQTVTVSGVKADSVVFVSPDPTSASDYASAGILCTAQAADSLTFSCTQTPSSAIVVNIVCM